MSAICSLTESDEISSIDLPSTRILPELSLKFFNIKETRVDFPAPEQPISQIFSFGLIVKLRFEKTGFISE
jgi:hypothetical protein